MKKVKSILAALFCAMWASTLLAGALDPVLEDYAITGGLKFDTGATITEFSTAAIGLQDNDTTIPTGAAIVDYGDAHWGGTVDTSGTPVANDIARFTDADTIEGRSYTELKGDLDLVIGTDVQAYHAYLDDIAGLTADQGDILYFDGTDWKDLAAGDSGKYLKTQGAGANPMWDTPSGGGMTGWFDVTDPAYGAVGDGTTNDTLAIQAAIDAAEAADGGIVFFPPGEYLVSDTDADGYCLEIEDGITLMGVGRQHLDWLALADIGTKITTAGTDDVIFYVNTVHPVNIRNMSLYYSGTAVSGASAIKVTYSSSGENRSSVFDSLLISRAWIGIELVKASHWDVSGCQIYNSKQYGIKIQNTNNDDSGDSVIRGCTIHREYATADGGQSNCAAVWQESSGGLRIVASKLQRHVYGYQLYMDGAGGGGGSGSPGDLQTSILNITGCSIEGNSSWGIKLENTEPYSSTTTGNIFSYVSITGNELDDGVYINGADATSLRDIQIVGNTITVHSNVAYTGYTHVANNGVSIGYAGRVIIAGNSFETKGTVTSLYGIYVSQATSTVTVGSNSYSTSIAATHKMYGITDHALFDNVSIGSEGGGNKALYLKGSDATGGHQGGRVFFYTPDDYDSTYNYFTFESYNDYLRWTNSAGGLMMYVTGPGNLTVTGSVSGCDVVDRGTCDFVFEPSYELMELDDLRSYIKENSRMPGITTPDGITMGELYVKAEEQSLYILQLHDRIKALEASLLN